MRVLKDGDWIFGNDLNALVEAFKGNAVESGCAVSDGGSTDMTVAVAAGVVEVAGVRVAVAGNNVVLAAASAFKRYDLIVVNNSGVASKVDGTVEKKAPDIPSGYVLLAIVEVPAAATGVTNANIYDCRVMDRAGAAYESADGDYIIDVDTDGNGSGAIKLRVNGTDAVIVSNDRSFRASGSNFAFGVNSSVQAGTGFLIETDVTPGIGASGAVIRLGTNNLTKAGSGTHPLFSAVQIAAPAIAGGAAGVTTSALLYLGDPMAGATNNYSIYALSGTSYFGGNVGVGITDPTVGSGYDRTLAVAAVGGEQTASLKLIGRRTADGNNIGILDFTNNPSGSTYHRVASIGVQRSGADNTSYMHVNVMNAGASVEVVRFQNTGLVDFRIGTNALGGGAGATLGTIGGAGPATAAQNAWLKIAVSGSVYWLPVWQ